MSCHNINFKEWDSHLLTFLHFKVSRSGQEEFLAVCLFSPWSVIEKNTREKRKGHALYRRACMHKFLVREFCLAVVVCHVSGRFFFIPINTTFVTCVVQEGKERKRKMALLEGQAHINSLLLQHIPNFFFFPMAAVTLVSKGFLKHSYRLSHHGRK